VGAAWGLADYGGEVREAPAAFAPLVTLLWLERPFSWGRRYVAAYFGACTGAKGRTASSRCEEELLNAIGQ
jgi:hypothetical protein